MFYTKVVEKIKTRILYSITFSENCSVYEIMSKNLVEIKGLQMTSQYCAHAHAHASVHAHANALARMHTHT
jgi:3-polyprenyl-4-hydroxybenzoate decarboxylase